MTELGRYMFLAGLGLLIIGAVVWALGRTGFRGLPGDISYRSASVRIYFPIVTSIVLSVLLTLGLWIWQWLSRR